MDLHPKMRAWLINELQNGRFELQDDEDEAILQQTLGELYQPETLKRHVIDDARVHHVWIDEAGNTVEITPDFYQNNGTPVDPETGKDLTYSHTDISLVEPHPEPRPTREGALTVQIAHDATRYRQRSFMNTSVDDLKTRVSSDDFDETGLEAIGDWQDDGHDAFPEVLAFNITDSAGNILFDSRDEENDLDLS